MANAPQPFAVRRDVRLNPSSIQEMLDENVRLIHSLMAHQKCGAVKEASELQQILHRNLIYLATIADRTAAHLNTPAQPQMHQGPPPGMPHTQVPPPTSAFQPQHAMPHVTNQTIDARPPDYAVNANQEASSVAPVNQPTAPPQQSQFYAPVQQKITDNVSESQPMEAEGTT